MEEARFSESFVNLYQATYRLISENITFHFLMFGFVFRSRIAVRLNGDFSPFLLNRLRFCGSWSRTRTQQEVGGLNRIAKMENLFKYLQWSGYRFDEPPNIWFLA
jgi:hypothetical protein